MEMSICARYSRTELASAPLRERRGLPRNAQPGLGSVELKLERSPAPPGVTDALGLRGEGASSLVVFNKTKIRASTPSMAVPVMVHYRFGS